MPAEDKNLEYAGETTTARCAPDASAKAIVDCIQRFERETLPLLGLLHQVAHRHTGQKADAEDLVQETLLRAFANYHSFREGTHLKAWLLRIMTNAWISSRRATNSRPRELLSEQITDEQLARASARGPADLQSAESRVMVAMREREIIESLLRLPEHLRLTAFYIDVAGFKSRELAEVMDIPLGTVLSRLHRSRQLLRALLADVAREHGIPRDAKSPQSGLEFRRPSSRGLDPGSGAVAVEAH